METPQMAALPFTLAEIMIYPAIYSLIAQKGFQRFQATIFALFFSIPSLFALLYRGMVGEFMTAFSLWICLGLLLLLFGIWAAVSFGRRKVDD